MILKYNSILTKIKLFYLILLGRIKKQNNKIKISNRKPTDVKNILIIFPIKDEDFRVALYSFRNLPTHNNINYYFLINCIHRQHFHLRGYVFDVLQNIKNNKIKIDETFYNDRILNKEYDFIIDLNKDFNFDISLLINKLNSTYKVGIKNNYSDYFYNIQFNFNTKDILEKIYNKMYLILK